MIKKKSFLKKERKKAVSMMVSYVILITIAIGMAITIYTWLRLVANVEPLPECGEGTSIIINDYVCEKDILRLSIKNNGRFTVDGFIIHVGDNPKREPMTRILPKDKRDYSAEGYYLFNPPLGPGEIREASFKSMSKENVPLPFTDIVNIKIQPYIFYESDGKIKKTKILCEKSVIKQDLNNCDIS
jgi:hypothetical protein